MNLPRRQRALHLPEGRRADVLVGQAEIHSISDVEEFAAKLQGFGLRESKVLEHREVGLAESRRLGNVGFIASGGLSLWSNSRHVKGHATV